MSKTKTVLVCQSARAAAGATNTKPVGNNNNNHRKKGNEVSHSTHSVSSTRSSNSRQQQQRSTTATSHIGGGGDKFHPRSVSERDAMAHRSGAGGGNKQNLIGRETTERESIPFNDNVNGGRRQVASTLASAPQRSKQPVETVCLSDSEEPEGLPLSPTAVPEKDPELLKTPPAKDIHAYYKNSGVTLSHVRRLNRNYIRNDGPSSEARGGLVFWDSYSPPPGFTVDDLPLNDSQSQPKEEVIVVSPAILNAERYKLKPRAVKKVDSDAEFQDLLDRLLKRKAPDKENEDSLENPKKKSTPEPDQELLAVADPMNTTFPDVGDDLNDSELMMFSQAAELEYNCGERISTDVPKPIVIPDMEKHKTEGQGERVGPMNTSTPIEPRVGYNVRNIVTETPKSVKSVGRNLRSNGGRTNSSNIFENSNINPGLGPLKDHRVLNRNIPRKSLFSEGSSSESPITTGDFADDDDDLLFSQLDLPQVERNDSRTDRRIQREVAEQSTQIINQSDSFLMRSDFLAEIDKLEEIAIGSTENVAISLAEDVKRQQNAPGIALSKTANCDSPARVLRGLGRSNGNRK